MERLTARSYPPALDLAREDEAPIAATHAVSEHRRAGGGRVPTAAEGEGQRTGGRYMYTITGEVDRLFYNDFGAAAFIDIGTSTNDLNTEPKKGSGIGLRWASPVGMVRVDLAWPINDPDKSKPRLHISIGTDL